MEQNQPAFKEKTPNGAENIYHEGKEKLEEAYNKTKEKAAEFYYEGIKKINEVQDNVQEHLKEYKGELIAAIKERPITALLIAGGVGFLLSSLLKK